MPHKQEAKAFKKQLNKKLTQAMMTKTMDADEAEAVSRIITFGSMPSYREDKMQEMKQRHSKSGPSGGEGTSSAEGKNRYSNSHQWPKDFIH